MANYPSAASAAKFNCGLYLTVDQVEAFDPGGFTIAMWLKWRDPNFNDPCMLENPGEDPTFTTSAADAYIFAYNDYQDPSNSTGGSRLTLSVPKNLVLWNSGASLETKVAINDKQWHFLTLTVIPGDAQHDQVTLFLDGTRAASGSLYHDAGFATPNGKQLGIGCEYANGSDSSLFTGNIAEFQIWKGSLAETKIAALMAAPPVPSKEPNLNVFIRLDQASVSGDRVTDLVGKHTGHIEVVQES